MLKDSDRYSIVLFHKEWLLIEQVLKEERKRLEKNIEEQQKYWDIVHLLDNFA